MIYQQYIEKFRNWQLEKDERIFENPMSEKEFESWIKPVEETTFTPKEKLTYKEMYLHLKKLFVGKDELLEKLEESYILNAKKFDLI